MVEDEIGLEEDLADTSSVAPATNVSDLKRKMKLEGTVTRLELYGAFIDVGLDVDAILHVSKLSKRVNRVSDLLSVGDPVTVYVESVDQEKSQVTVTMQEPLAVEWSDLKEGQKYSGKVTRLEKFGAFVDIGAEKEGLVHVSELSHDYVKHPSEVVKVDDEIDVVVLGFNKRKRRIDLSRKVLLETPEAMVEEIEELDLEEEEDEELPTAMEIALRQAMGGPSDRGKAAVKRQPKAKSQSQKARDRQDDILSRTLKLGQESVE